MVKPTISKTARRVASTLCSPTSSAPPRPRRPRQIKCRVHLFQRLFNAFAISEKNHHQSDICQTATWTLSAGEFIPFIHITGVYLSPDNKVPTSEIKDLYTNLNNNFHTPSPHSPQNLQCNHYHILAGDFNSWVGMEQEEHLANHLGFPHIPIRIGDPHPRRQPQDRVHSSASTTTHARARGRLLLDFLNDHTLIIANDRFLPSPNDSNGTYENRN